VVMSVVSSVSGHGGGMMGGANMTAMWIWAIFMTCVVIALAIAFPVVLHNTKQDWKNDPNCNGNGSSTAGGATGPVGPAQSYYTVPWGALTHTDCQGYASCADVPNLDYLPYQYSYPADYPYGQLTNTTFPEGFIFGLGSASYQIEGGYKQDGRGASIWDTYTGADTVGMVGSQCSTAPCTINLGMNAKGHTGNVACNFRNLYKEDIYFMKTLNLPFFRFSVAWPRVMPDGLTQNQAGMNFYIDVVKELAANGVKPLVTLYHWDLPQALLPAITASEVCTAGAYAGWFECELDSAGEPQPKQTSSGTLIASAFAKYTEFVYRALPSVEYWFTFNECWSVCALGSGSGKAPSTAPYMDYKWQWICAQNVIYAHLESAKIFKSLKASNVLLPTAKIGVTNNIDWSQPATNTPQDIAQAITGLMGGVGWFADPIFGYNGVHDYPSELKMSQTIPTLPQTVQDDLKANRPDFFGMNTYGLGFQHDGAYIQGPLLPRAQATWLVNAGWGFRQLLNFIQHRYLMDGNTPLYVTEFGWNEQAENSHEYQASSSNAGDSADGVLEGALYDPARMAYYYSYVYEALKAIHIDGVNLMGMTPWSFSDNFEWDQGYTQRFGLAYADFNLTAPNYLNIPDPVNFPEYGASVYDPWQDKITGTCGMACYRGKPTENQARWVKGSLDWWKNVWTSGSMPDIIPYYYGIPDTWSRVTGSDY